jgi:hypothetical protein
VSRGQHQGLLDTASKSTTQALSDPTAQGPQAARHRATQGFTLSPLELAAHFESSGLQGLKLTRSFVVGDLEGLHLP